MDYKGKLARLMIIKGLLEASRLGLTVAELEKIMDCSYRTIYRDIEVLSSSGVMITEIENNSRHPSGGKTATRFIIQPESQNMDSFLSREVERLTGVVLELEEKVHAISDEAIHYKRLHANLVSTREYRRREPVGTK